MSRIPFSLEAIEIIDAIERRGSFAAAAEELGKAPSALTYIVQKLEEQLDVTLFERQGRRSVLTEAGKHFLGEGRKLLLLGEQVVAKTKEMDSGWEPKLKVAVDSIVEPSLAYEALTTFSSTHPSVDLEIEEHVLGGSWEQLIDGDLDLVIGAPGPVPSHKGLRAKPWLKYERIFVVSPAHPLASLKRPVTYDDLDGYKTIVVKDSSINAVPRSVNLLSQTQHIYVSSIEHKIVAQAAGLGVGFLPRQRIERQLEKGELLAVPTELEYESSELFLAWKLANKGKALKALVVELERAIL